MSATLRKLDEPGSGTRERGSEDVSDDIMVLGKLGDAKRVGRKEEGVSRGGAGEWKALLKPGAFGVENGIRLPSPAV